jgi:chemotaxis protein methyltransferase WspC
MNVLAEIREGLRIRTGFSGQFLPEEAIRSVVRARIQALQARDEHDYWVRLHDSDAEWGNLVDDLVVPETWFLRDQKPFEFLSELVKKRWLHDSRKVRLLSAPCSTGEEAYSIAITLLEAGLNLDRVSIQALDISERSLAVARKQIYRRQSFRAGSLHQTAHFVPLSVGEFRVAPPIAQAVNFRQSNLLDPGCFKEEACFDVIFCRNLLIYLEDDARQKVFAALHRLLAPDGVLFVGHADAGTFSKTSFQGFGPSAAFAFSKAVAKATVPERTIASPPARFAKVTTPLTKKVVDLVTSSRPSKPAPRTPVEPSLEDAVRFADAGRLSEATRVLHDYLKLHRTCPNGIHLLAVIRIAEGKRTEAEQLLNQVAYLDPNHAEAMVQLASLCEIKGDHAAAKRWRTRVERTQAAQNK